MKPRYSSGVTSSSFCPWRILFPLFVTLLLHCILLVSVQLPACTGISSFSSSSFLHHKSRNKSIPSANLTFLIIVLPVGSCSPGILMGGSTTVSVGEYVSRVEVWLTGYQQQRPVCLQEANTNTNLQYHVKSKWVKFQIYVTPFFGKISCIWV